MHPPVKMLVGCIPHLPAVDAPVFGAKMLIDAEIMAKKEIQDGGRPPSWIFENLISDQLVALGC